MWKGLASAGVEGEIEPPPPDPKVGALKGWAMWTRVLSHWWRECTSKDCCLSMLSKTRTNKRQRLKSFSLGGVSNPHWQQQTGTVPPRQQSRRAHWSPYSSPPGCSSKMSHGSYDIPSPPHLLGSLPLVLGYKQPLPEQSCKMCFIKIVHSQLIPVKFMKMHVDSSHKGETFQQMKMCIV